MSGEEIKRLRVLLAKATPGEWLVLHESVWRERGNDQPATVAWVADWCVARSGPSYEFHGDNKDDAAFIAAAKNSMAALLDAAEENARLRSAADNVLAYAAAALYALETRPETKAGLHRALDALAHAALKESSR